MGASLTWEGVFRLSALLDLCTPSLLTVRFYQLTNSYIKKTYQSATESAAELRHRDLQVGREGSSPAGFGGWGPRYLKLSGAAGLETNRVQNCSDLLMSRSRRLPGGRRHRPA